MFRENIEKMQPYEPGEQPREAGYIKLNTNENPYPPSPRVTEAIAEEAERLRLYPDPLASEFRERVAGLHGLAPRNVIVGNGCDDVLTMLTRAFAGEGETVASPSPTYTLYKTLCEIQGARYVPVPYNDDYSLDIEKFPGDAKLNFICNPNSPSGTVLSFEMLEELAARTEGALVVDEAYVDFAPGDCAGLLDRFDNVIITRSLSKSFSLAGLRIGYGLAREEVVRNLVKVKDSYNVNRLAIAGGIAALQEVNWMRRNVRRLIATREMLARELKNLGFYVFPSGANFLLARTERYPAKNIYEQLRRRKILVRYYNLPRLEDCVRISVGSDGDIAALLSALKEILGRKG